MRPLDIPVVSVDQLPGDAVLLDVREANEWAAGHAEQAIHIPMSELPARLTREPDAISPEQALVVVCRVGARSAQVTAWLNQQGFQATNLEGGMVAWQSSNRPMVSDTGAPPTVL